MIYIFNKIFTSTQFSFKCKLLLIFLINVTIILNMALILITIHWSVDRNLILFYKRKS